MNLFLLLWSVLTHKVMTCWQLYQSDVFAKKFW